MDPDEYQQIVDYLQIAEHSKYGNADIKARFQAEPASSYGAHMDCSTSPTSLRFI
jgi:hypothetical protein